VSTYSKWTRVHYQNQIKNYPNMLISLLNFNIAADTARHLLVPFPRVALSEIRLNF